MNLSLIHFLLVLRFWNFTYFPLFDDRWNFSFNLSVVVVAFKTPFLLNPLVNILVTSHWVLKCLKSILLDYLSICRYLYWVLWSLALLALSALNRVLSINWFILSGWLPIVSVVVVIVCGTRVVFIGCLAELSRFRLFKRASEFEILLKCWLSTHDWWKLVKITWVAIIFNPNLEVFTLSGNNQASSVL